MSRVGLDWYKREPVAYLGDVQGLTSKEHAVYSIIIDLLYTHGGSIRNDPKWISGWISDMGISSVRKSIASLGANDRITLEVTEGEISQKRAKTEAKTKQNQRETAQKNGSKGGIKSSENRRNASENNDIPVANGSSEIQAEKRREEKIEKRITKVIPKNKGTRLSDEWFLPKDYGTWAIEQGLTEAQIRFEAERFHDHWLGASGQRGVKLDWKAVWRNWIRKFIADGGLMNGKRTYSETASHRDSARIVDENAIATGLAISRATGRA